jgi:hypothetical protein
MLTPKRPGAIEIDGGGHARDDRRRQRQDGRGREELDVARHRGKARHEREGLEVVVPELGLAAEAAQLDHREREFEPVALRLLDDLLVELEARLVLRRFGRDQPAIVSDRNEDADVHAQVSLVRCGRWYGRQYVRTNANLSA